MIRTLVVPDLHHNLPWLGRVLDAERGRYDRLVLLGDYFDAHRPVSNAKQVARCLLGLPAEVERQNGRPVPVTFLVGNHDYPYAMLEHSKHPPKDAWSVPGGCTGYSRTRAGDVSSVLRGTGFWDRCALVTEAGGYLLSHAGVLPHLWSFLPVGAMDEDDTEADIADAEYCRTAEGLYMAWLRRHTGPPSPLFAAVGPARGGSGAGRAGLLWCDWHEEFEDALPLPQIVGHTGPAPGEDAARQKGRSWCIDGHQTCYALIHGGAVGDPGAVEIKSA